MLAALQTTKRGTTKHSDHGLALMALQSTAANMSLLKKLDQFKKKGQG